MTAEVREIPLTQDQVAIIDAADYERVSQHKWFACWHHRYYVAATKVNYKLVYMHRFILGGDSPHVDHIDGDGLNNRRSNLRPATHKQNIQNQKKTTKPTHSQYKGVTLHRGRWVAYIQENGRRKHLGYFDEEIEAARAYDTAAKEIFGEFARTNL